jgi:hypothetical protein
MPIDTRKGESRYYGAGASLNQNSKSKGALSLLMPLSLLQFAPTAGVAQLVEQRIRNAKVGSSILFTGTTPPTCPVA